MNSYEVRKLQTCCLCSRLGIYRPSNPSIGWPLVVCLHSDMVSKRHRKYAHPNCYLEEMGAAKLLALPNKELEVIRLCDVSSRVMQFILRKFSEKR